MCMESVAICTKQLLALLLLPIYHIIVSYLLQISLSNLFASGYAAKVLAKFHHVREIPVILLYFPFLAQVLVFWKTFLTSFTLTCLLRKQLETSVRIVTGIPYVKGGAYTIKYYKRKSNFKWCSEKHYCQAIPSFTYRGRKILPLQLQINGIRLGRLACIGQGWEHGTWDRIRCALCILPSLVWEKSAWGRLCVQSILVSGGFRNFFLGVLLRNLN